MLLLPQHAEVVRDRSQTQTYPGALLLLHELRRVLRSLWPALTHRQVRPLLCRPQEDPVDDIPLFDLEGSVTAEPPALNDTLPEPLLSRLKMDTIVEIEGSENFTLNMGSPRVDLFLKNSKSREFTLGEEAPKRMRVRMRSQSDNSEYLIFNFLERVNEK